MRFAFPPYGPAGKISTFSHGIGKAGIGVAVAGIWTVGAGKNTEAVWFRRWDWSGGSGEGARVPAGKTPVPPRLPPPVFGIPLGLVGHHDHGDRGLDFRGQADGHLIGAQLLDGFRQV